MSNHLEDSKSEPSAARPFQFSLRTLFIVSFLFAIFCAGIFSKYDVVRYLTLLAHETFWFYIFLAWAIYARGYLRTFGIGASISFLFPWLVTAYLWFVCVFYLFYLDSPGNGLSDVFQTKSLEDGISFFWASIAALILVGDGIFTGGTMVLARWLIDRSRREAQAEQPIVGTHREYDHIDAETI
jgi:hypothetical protein